MESRIPALVATAVALLVIGGCGGGGNKDKNAKTTGAQKASSTINGQNANNKGTADVSAKTSSELELDDFYFNPTVLKGKPSQKLTLELKNEGKVEHNFSLPQLSVDKDVQPGANATVTVNMPKSGTLLFFCKYHQAQGMRGGLQVSGAAGGSAGQSGGGSSQGGQSSSSRGGY